MSAESAPQAPSPASVGAIPAIMGAHTNNPNTQNRNIHPYPSRASAAVALWMLYNSVHMKSVLTPLDFLARSAWVYRDRIAVVDGDRRFTYAEFNQRVHRQASALRAFGVLPGDRVAVLAANSAGALEAHFGVLLAGAVLVMLNTRLQAGELAWILNHCEARVAIADPELAAGLPPHIRAITDYEGWLAQGEFPAAGTPPPE